ncbi:MAG: hypothetical protein KGJ57_17665 [Sphingomonadales bacterium]|nr:hypothetical protein [Sphingomonadales bacterium]MDE2171227.1 hypothetical protein [Sphingomonadales bacterium]
MPSGFTADVQSGKITTLKEFAWRCARGMGALIMMRDEPLAAPIPERFEPSPYHENRLREVESELEALRAMQPEEWQAAADAEHDEIADAHATWMEEQQEQRQRYEAMIAKVMAWTGEPEGIKDFMLDQLHSSMSFDCPRHAQFFRSLDYKTGHQWKVEREQQLTRDMAYHAKNYHEEITRTESRNAWLSQLRKSLEGEAA